MTGFGNFSYYYIRRDFSVVRFCQMMWRLHFMVFFVCLTMQNDYMLYYICMLHTTFTIFIYAILGIKSDMNYRTGTLGLKLGLTVAAVLAIWLSPARAHEF